MSAYVQPPRIEVEAREEALVVVGLTGGAYRLRAEAPQLNIAARLLIERRTCEQLLALLR